MKRFFFFGIVFGFITLGAGVYFWSSDGVKQSYENPESVFFKGATQEEMRENRGMTEKSDDSQTTPTKMETIDQESFVPTVPIKTTPTTEIATNQQAASLTNLEIHERRINFGFRSADSRSIDTIVLHSSYNASGGDVYDIDKIVKQYEDYGVGAHYLIDRTGKVYRLIAEKDVAYHAGASKMPDGRKNVNEFSIGIEIAGTLESGYTQEQYTAVNALIDDIKSRYKIKSIVGHADIAPDRKTDPWKFDWKKVNV